MVFYQGWKIDNYTHVTDKVSQSSDESAYNAACTAVMATAHFRILDNEFPNKNPDVVTKQEPIIILDCKSDLCMANYVKETKQTRHTSRRMHFVRNGGEWNLHKKVWCEGGPQFSYIGTTNVRED